MRVSNFGLNMVSKVGIQLIHGSTYTRVYTVIVGPDLIQLMLISTNGISQNISNISTAADKIGELVLLKFDVFRMLSSFAFFFFNLVKSSLQ
jgi:hypothetical protein